MLRKFLLAFLLVLTLPVTGLCAAEPTTTQLQTLQGIYAKILVVDELAQRNLITEPQKAQSEQAFCDDAKAILGHDVTPSQLQALMATADQRTGLSVFWNIVIVIAGILCLIAVLGLLAYYLKDILVQIPPAVYELFAYIATAVTILSGYFWQPFHLGLVVVEPLWFAIPGGLALLACLVLTKEIHFSSGRRRDSVYAGPLNFETVLFFICTVVWAATAVFYHRLFPDAGIPHVIAFGAVIALQASLGFSVLTMPGCIALGWETDKQVPKSVTSSFIILAAYVLLKLSHGSTGSIGLFEPGAIFMGAFVYFLGLLVMSSKWYVWSTNNGGDGGNYILLQFVTIASGAAALYLGSTFHMGALLGVGGTFFTIYALEKYYELPWKGVWWFWSLFGVGLFLYFFVGFAKSNPQYFIWGIH